MARQHHNTPREKRAQVWLVVNGAEKTTVTMFDSQTGQLIEALHAASRGLP